MAKVYAAGIWGDRRSEIYDWASSDDIELHRTGSEQWSRRIGSFVVARPAHESDIYNPGDFGSILNQPKQQHFALGPAFAAGPAS